MLTVMNAYLINMPGASERLRESLIEIDAQGLRHSVVVAETPETIECTESFHQPLGAISCFESHKKAWITLIHDEMPFGLICEDDIQFSSKIDWQEIINTFENIEWDVIQIGFLKIGILATLEIAVKNLEFRFFRKVSTLLRMFGLKSTRLAQRKRIREAGMTPRGYLYGDFQSGTHCYLLSVTGFHKMINLQTSFAPIDGALHLLAESSYLNCYRLFKSMASQRDTPSLLSLRNH